MMHRENSFEAVALPFLDSLYRTAFRMVHDQRTAERCVEEAYVEACTSFRDLPEATDHRAWLFAILFHSLHKRRKPWLNIKGWLTRSLEEPQKPAEAAAADRDEILPALDSIPGIFREVLLLVDVEGFNKSEAERILGIP